MTIKPGDPWGRQVPRPADLVTVDNDRALVAALDEPGRSPVSVSGGDLARTLGVGAAGPRPANDTVNELPIDLVRVTLDDRHTYTACAHVVARSPWSRGHLWQGPILVVMNAEFIGDFDVAPRGHPNDGRVETFEVDPRMSIRDRLGARRRLPSASHLPHPDISSRSVRTRTWTFPRELVVVIDAEVVGRASTISVEAVPDAAVVYA